MIVRHILVERLRAGIRRGIGWLFGPMPPPVHLPEINTTAADLLQPTSYLAALTQPGDYLAMLILDDLATLIQPRNYAATLILPDDYGAVQIP